MRNYVKHFQRGKFPFPKWVLRETGLFVLFSLVLGYALAATILYFLPCFYSRRLEASFIFLSLVWRREQLHLIYCVSSIAGMDVFLFIYFWNLVSSFMLCCTPRGQVGSLVSYDITTCISSWPSSAPRLHLGGINVLYFFSSLVHAMREGSLALGLRKLWLSAAA